MTPRGRPKRCRLCSQPRGVRLLVGKRAAVHGPELGREKLRVAAPDTEDDK
jgi:hypothetical protein